MEGERAEPSRLKLGLFAAGLAAYYAFYYLIFASKVGRYFEDIVRHRLL